MPSSWRRRGVRTMGFITCYVAAALASRPLAARTRRGRSTRQLSKATVPLVNWELRGRTASAKIPHGGTFRITTTASCLRNSGSPRLEQNRFNAIEVFKPAQRAVNRRAYLICATPDQETVAGIVTVGAWGRI